jgi:hypothetical protein
MAPLLGVRRAQASVCLMCAAVALAASTRQHGQVARSPVLHVRGPGPALFDALAHTHKQACLIAPHTPAPFGGGVAAEARLSCEWVVPGGGVL